MISVVDSEHARAHDAYNRLAREGAWRLAAGWLQSRVEERPALTATRRLTPRRKPAPKSRPTAVPDGRLRRSVARSPASCPPLSKSPVPLATVDSRAAPSRQASPSSVTSGLESPDEYSETPQQAAGLTAGGMTDSLHDATGHPTLQRNHLRFMIRAGVIPGEQTLITSRERRSPFSGRHGGIRSLKSR